MKLRDPWPFVLIYFILGKAYDAFLVSYNRIFEMFPEQIVAILVHDRDFRDYPPKRTVVIQSDKSKLSSWCVGDLPVKEMCFFAASYGSR